VSGSATKTDEGKKIWAECPLGCFEGEVVTHRSVTDADIIAWLQRVQEFLEVR